MDRCATTTNVCFTIIMYICHWCTLSFDYLYIHSYTHTAHSASSILRSGTMYINMYKLLVVGLHKWRGVRVVIEGGFSQGHAYITFSFHISLEIQGREWHCYITNANYVNLYYIWRGRAVCNFINSHLILVPLRSIKTNLTALLCHSQLVTFFGCNVILSNDSGAFIWKQYNA